MTYSSYEYIRIKVGMKGNAEVQYLPTGGKEQVLYIPEDTIQGWKDPQIARYVMDRLNADKSDESIRLSVTYAGIK